MLFQVTLAVAHLISQLVETYIHRFPCGKLCSRTMAWVYPASAECLIEMPIPVLPSSFNPLLEGRKAMAALLSNHVSHNLLPDQRLNLIRIAFTWRSVTLLKTVLRNSPLEELQRQLLCIQGFELGHWRDVFIDTCLNVHLNMPPAIKSSILSLLPIVSATELRDRMNHLSREIIEFWDYAFPAEVQLECLICRRGIQRYSALVGEAADIEILFCCGALRHHQCLIQRNECPKCHKLIETYSDRAGSCAYISSSDPTPPPEHEMETWTVVPPLYSLRWLTWGEDFHELARQHANIRQTHSMDSSNPILWPSSPNSNFYNDVSPSPSGQESSQSHACSDGAGPSQTTGASEVSRSQIQQNSVEEQVKNFLHELDFLTRNDNEDE